MTIEEMIRVYDFLAGKLGKEDARKYVAAHAARNSVEYIDNEDGEITGAAIYWQISDPYDVEIYGYPGEDPAGKYLYFPVLFVEHNGSSGPTSISGIKRLLAKCFLKSPRARRAAFHRPRDGRRVLKILDLE